MNLTTSPVFKGLTVPATKEEEEALAASIIREGCKEPIAVWQGIILDGHKRYNVCTMEHIGFTVEEAPCATEEEAVSWVCRRRTAGLNNTSQAYRYLMGKWYLSEVSRNRATRKPRLQAEGEGYDKSKHRTSFLMSQELGLHHSTLEKYGSYAAALDTLFEAEPDLLDAVMSGAVFLSMEATLELARAEEGIRKEKLRKVVRDAYRKERPRRADVRKAAAKEQENQIPLSIGIKNMPAFNPDMELQGLTLTIPTWMNAMGRAISRSDMAAVTEEAKGNLRKALERLMGQVRETMEALQ